MLKIKITIILILLLLLSCYSVNAKKVQYASMSADGYLSNSDADYFTARDSIDADTMNVAGVIKIGQTSGAQWTVSRGFFYFDTSGIPDDARAQKAWLYYYVASNPIHMRVLVDSSNTLPRTPALTTDSFHIDWYDLYGPPYLLTGTGWKNILVVDKYIEGNVNVNAFGTTKFALISESDYQGQEYATGIMEIHSANDVNKPYLLVQYNTPPSIPTLEGSSKASTSSGYRLYMISTDDDEEPENNKIKYRIDWGDGEVSWAPTLHTESGTKISTTHRYNKIGSFTIKVSAYDNSGETNDNSGVASKTIEVVEGPVPDQEEGIFSKIASWFSWLFPPEDEGPNQKFNKLKGAYITEGEQKHLKIWWDVNKAALEQSNLMVHIQIETISGTTSLGTFNVREHTSYEKAYVVLNWDEKFPGHTTWSFTIRAQFLNPTEPADSPKDDNEISVMFLLGLLMDMDFFILLLFVIILVVSIILLYRFRKRIWWKHYVKKKYTQAELNEMPDGYIKDLIIEMQRKKKRWPLPKEKPGSIFGDIMKDIKQWKSKKPKQISSEPIYRKTVKPIFKKKYITTKPVAKKPKTKHKKEKETKKEKIKHKKTILREFIGARTFEDLYNKPEIAIPDELDKEIDYTQRRLRALRGKIERDPKLRKEKERTITTYQNKINRMKRVKQLNAQKNRLRGIMNSNATMKNKMQSLYSAGIISDHKILGKVLIDVNKGKTTEQEAEKKIVGVYNNIQQEIHETLKKTGHPELKTQKPSDRMVTREYKEIQPTLKEEPAPERKESRPYKVSPKAMKGLARHREIQKVSKELKEKYRKNLPTTSSDVSEPSRFRKETGNQFSKMLEEEYEERGPQEFERWKNTLLRDPEQLQDEWKEAERRAEQIVPRAVQGQIKPRTKKLQRYMTETKMISKEKPISKQKIIKLKEGDATEAKCPICGNRGSIIKSMTKERDGRTTVLQECKKCKKKWGWSGYYRRKKNRFGKVNRIGSKPKKKKTIKGKKIFRRKIKTKPKKIKKVKRIKRKKLKRRKKGGKR
jgi:DNA-directed RNA polymerase subunit M/transcription elongation factor TFIIS